MKRTPRAKKVLIAGAGIAGLYAADLLQGRGFDVEIVEALDRVGGKLLGGTIAGIPFDFGGQGFSKKMKRVEALGKRFGLTCITTPGTENFFLEGGVLLTGADFEKIRAERLAFDFQAAAHFSGLHDTAKRARWQALSVMDLARDHFTSTGLAYFRTNFASEWCSLPEEVSLLHYLEIQKAFEGDEADEMAFRYREGFSALTNHLADRLGDRIRLGTPLEGVSVQSGGVRALVGGGNIIEAAAMVLAIPLPCIRNIQFAGFDARALLGSLSAYRGSEVRKILAVYERPFWRNKPCGGEFDRPCGMSMLDNSDTEKKAYSMAIFLGGPSARKNLDQAAVLKHVAEVLGEEALAPIGYHAQVWLGEDHVPGGYASNRVPSQRGSGVLPTSLAGRIFLAGSETAGHFPTYVEGGLASAERAAECVARSLELESVVV